MHAVACLHSVTPWLSHKQNPISVWYLHESRVQSCTIKWTNDHMQCGVCDWGLLNLLQPNLLQKAVYWWAMLLRDSKIYLQSKRIDNSTPSDQSDSIHLLTKLSFSWAAAFFSSVTRFLLITAKNWKQIWQKPESLLWMDRILFLRRMSVSASFS